MSPELLVFEDVAIGFVTYFVEIVHVKLANKG